MFKESISFNNTLFRLFSTISCLEKDRKNSNLVSKKTDDKGLITDKNIEEIELENSNKDKFRKSLQKKLKGKRNPINRETDDMGLITEEKLEEINDEVEKFFDKLDPMNEEIDHIGAITEKDIEETKALSEIYHEEIKVDRERHKKHIINLDNNELYKPIKNRYVHDTRNKPILVSFDIWELEDIDIFTKRLEKNLVINEVYTVFVKVRYNIDNFFMAGNQFGFNYDSGYKLNEVYDTVHQRLELYMESYNLTNEDIVYVELSFRKKDKILLSELSIDKKNFAHVEDKDTSENDEFTPDLDIALELPEMEHPEHDQNPD